MAGVGAAPSAALAELGKLILHEFRVTCMLIEAQGELRGFVVKPSRQFFN